MLDFQKLSAQYQQALLRQVVPFWLKHSRDGQCGGYSDMLTATGEAVDGDKFVTLQAQQLWAFSWLHNTFDGQSAWLDHARHGANFLNQFAHDATLNCYSQLDRRGRPVTSASTPVPDCYLVMAYAQFHKSTAEDEWAMLAKQTFSNVMKRREVTRLEQSTAIGGFRQLQHLSEPIAVLKATLEMQPLLDEETWKQNIDLVLLEILYEFVDRRSDILREYVLPEGAFSNTPEGRRLNVGLTFQTANYLFDLYAKSRLMKTAQPGPVNRKLATQVVTWCLQLCEQAWDETTSGLNQYVDCKGAPFIFPDWQQKWAWVHIEAIAALLKGYVHTRNPDCLKWFKRIHDYTFQYFPDLKHTGWHVVIDQHGQPLLPVKALPSLGCYSLIRCLAETAQTLMKCEPLQPASRTNAELFIGSQSTRQTT
ncbi:AGE family epimerase/isomerase [Spirosoma validum]|uniref:AGE family epimerase/isomerase n=1 Tax=Spirosoma validum TaxID=2771355 RepID=A0A927B756_9BACT|nr:AGE family epimerase/isomerase [Spirosoma validum]MBD2756964.1 AGE family epimerase/isomerase [Spirosoma validum]